MQAATPIAKLLDNATGEILARTTIQYQLSLGALAGLGVLISQIKNLQDSGTPLVYAGAAILYSLIGLLQLEHDRKIALLGAHRRRLERALLRDYTGGEVGWEDYREQLGPNQFSAVFADSSRYLMTFGAAIVFVGVYYNVATSDEFEDEYQAISYGLAAVVALLIATTIALGGLVAKATRQRDDERAPNPMSPPPAAAPPPSAPPSDDDGAETAP